MIVRRWIAAVLGAVLVAPVLVACTPSQVVAGSEVRVAVSDRFTSLNAASASGRASSASAAVAELTGAAFGHVDARGDVVLDESFGTAEIFALDPLTVQYTIAANARWSDGVAVDAVDLLLAWAAGSGALDDPAPTPGEAVVDGAVRFDGVVPGGLAFATQTPQFGGERVIFVHFDRYVADWQTALAPGVAAHALARVALGLGADATAADAKTAVADAIRSRDAADLAALSRVWSHDLDLDETGAGGPDPALRVASGPYAVVEFAAETVVLRANPEYIGDRRPQFETLRLRAVPDPLEAIELVRTGELDVASLQLSADAVAALTDLRSVKIIPGVDTRVERIDLQFDDARNPAFRDPLVRRAFLLTVPRDRLVADALGALGPEARPLDSFIFGETERGYAEAVADNGSERYAAPDLVEAQRLLAESGQSKPRVCILFDPNDPVRARAFELIAESASEAGFRISDCSHPDWESRLGAAGTYDAALLAWDPRPGGAAESLGALFRSDSAVANLNRYANPEVDRLLDLLDTPLPEERRQSVRAQIDAALWADAYGLPLYSHPTVTLVRDTVEAVSPSPYRRGIAASAWEWRPAP